GQCVPLNSTMHDKEDGYGRTDATILFSDIDYLYDPSLTLQKCHYSPRNTYLVVFASTVVALFFETAVTVFGGDLAGKFIKFS
ncbi:hypothetical protein Ciccas_011220, partial [Cichlidogyrus casuarinus]